MKKFLSIILFSLFPLIAFAQVREMVCIVSPNYSEKVVQMIYDFIPRIKKLGVEDPQKYVEDFLAKNTSGSGFVYVAPDGKNYIITNRHVISDASTSTITFEDENTKELKVFNGMKILASDAALDLAILEFPDNQQPFTNGLELYTGNLPDGASVYTAGFPGLMGKPVWQFGNGIITNPSVEVEEMIKPELSSLIQHSAQIDAGNSGGPLLVKTKTGNYKVAGINTWKLTNRQDTNFAIPAATVKKFIDAALSGEKIETQEPQTVILEKATNLHKSLNRYNVTFEELVEYISIEYVETEGKAIFDKVINRCSIENKKTMNKILKDYSPIEAVRYAIGWYIFNEFHQYELVTDQSKKSSVKESRLPQLNPPEQIEGSNYWNTRLLNGETKKVLIVTWSYVNGGWEILTVKNKAGTKDDYAAEKRANAKFKADTTESILKLTEGKENKLGNSILYMPYTFQIAYGKNIFTRQPENLHVLYSNTLDVNIKIKNYLSAVVAAEVMEESVYIYKYGEDFPGAKINYILPYAGIQLQLPFLKSFITMPYLTLLGGVQLSDFDDLYTDIAGTIRLGSKFYFGWQKKAALFADTNLKYKFVFTDREKDEYAFNAALGLAF